jgi:eukaryotic-like serine/threonine-protein kinase
MLAPGSRIGPFEVLAPLGAGGMGEVYRARDRTLEREVALKTLPEAVSREPTRLARLRREARILASLSHPGIATLHGLEESGDGVPVLVMELVRGETLADRLRRGALPLKDALSIGRQVAEALASAHERGVLHRDLKPANISLTPEGRIKLLDFGLARALEQDAPDLHSQVSTATSPPSDAGRVLGTAPYMSPEQARGQEVDRRADIWSLGCVLYELLTGKRAFPGATFSETAAAVLEREPDWSALPGGTPGALRRLLRRCLRKERDERLRDAADAGLELREMLAELSSVTASSADVLASPTSGRGRRSKKLITAALTLGAGLAIVTVLALPALRRPAREVRQPRFQIALPRGVTISGTKSGSACSVLAISPDGERIAFVGASDHQQLYVRDRRELDAKPLADTEGAYCPFFSPDGHFIGFGSNDKLKKVAVDGGPVVTLVDAPSLRGASWGEDGTILFTRARSGLMRITADGGEAQPVTRLGPDDYDHRWPVSIDHGRTAVFETLRKGGFHDIATVDLVSGASHHLIEKASYPRYTATGHLLFGRTATLFGVPFDPRTRALGGHPVPLLEGVAMSRSSGFVYYDLGRDGTLVYSPAPTQLPKRTLVWVSRRGQVSPVSPRRQAYENARLSPDGRRIATFASVDIETGVAGESFALDIGRETWTRLRPDASSAIHAFREWLPDGERALLARKAPDGLSLVMARLDGTGTVETVTREEASFLVAVAPDGRSLLLSRQSAAGQWDIFALSLEGDHTPRPWLGTPSGGSFPSFSRDGRFVAYCPNDSDEVYVRPYAGGGRWQVSTRGGYTPRWSRDGREIFFVSDDRMWTVPVRTTPSFSAGEPQELFTIPEDILPVDFERYDVAPDGRRFLMIQQDPDEMRPIELVVVPNWLEEVQAKMAAAR